MSQEELKKREKRILYNFTSIFLLITAITIGAITGIIYIAKLLI